MIDLTIHKEQLGRTIQEARERNIIVPPFAQMRDPVLIPNGVKGRLKNVGLWDVTWLDLFRITWQNQPAQLRVGSESNGLSGTVPPTSLFHPRRALFPRPLDHWFD